MNAATPPPPALDPTRVRECHSVGVGRSLLAVKVDPTSRFLAAGGMVHELIQYELPLENGLPAWTKTGKLLRVGGFKSWIAALAFSADGKRLFAADYAGWLHAFDFPLADAKQPPAWSHPAHQGWIRAVALSPDGKWIGTCGNDRAVRLWSTADGKLVRELPGHECHVYNLAFHPREERLATGDLEGTVKEWNVATGRQLRQMAIKEMWVRQQNLQLGGIRSMAFHRGGNLLACGGMYGFGSIGDGIGGPCVMCLDWQSGKRVSILKARDSHRAFVNGVHFHASGLTLAATGGLDGGMLMFWKGLGPEEEALHQHKLPQSAWAMDLFPDRRHLALAHHDGNLRIVDLSPPPTPAK